MDTMPSLEAGEIDPNAKPTITLVRTFESMVTNIRDWKDDTEQHADQLTVVKAVFTAKPELSSIRSLDQTWADRAAAAFVGRVKFFLHQVYGKTPSLDWECSERLQAMIAAARPEENIIEVQQSVPESRPGLDPTPVSYLFHSGPYKPSCTTLSLCKLRLVLKELNRCDPFARGIAGYEQHDIAVQIVSVSAICRGTFDEIFTKSFISRKLQSSEIDCQDAFVHNHYDLFMKKLGISLADCLCRVCARGDDLL